MGKRVFIIVLDSVGAGEAPDAAAYGDEGSNTLGTVSKHPAFHMPYAEALGLSSIRGTGMKKQSGIIPEGAYGKMQEASCGKILQQDIGRSQGLFPRVLCRCIRTDFRKM